jgi:lysophospholipase L1-like esterase
MRSKILVTLRLAATLAVIALLGNSSRAAESLLPQGARLAIVGDSITEQKLYSKYIETYLLACAGRPDVKVFQFGWGGETAGGFADRLENDLPPFKPTVATTCYGMNDGQYRPYAEDIGRACQSNTRRVITGLRKIGVERIVLGSPGAVDTRYFVNNRFAPLSGAEGYNLNLSRLRDINQRLAEELGVTFADVHQPMVDAMTKAKAALGNDYDVCGRDGVHPGPNGHLIMAYAFLRALGCDGPLAQITIDMQGAPTASDGHKIVAGGVGKAEVESARYPFCLDGNATSPNGTRSITAFFPFNQDLNRFTLRVKNLIKDKARVTWGEESKDFARQQLEAGINLASEFTRTPFDAAFRRVLDAVEAKQNFETTAIKSLITNFRRFESEARNDPQLSLALSAVERRLMARQEQLDTAVRAALAPVKHTIAVSAVE